MSLRSTLARIGSLATLLLASPVGHAQAIDISKAPLGTSSPSVVKPNLLFIMDDSGSMAFDYMPDHTRAGHCRSGGATATSPGSFTGSCCVGFSTSQACHVGTPPFDRRMMPPLLAAEFNGVAYNPAITYLPPVGPDGNVAATRPSMTAANTNDWTAVPNDGYSVVFTNTINLVRGMPDVAWCPSGAAAHDISTCVRNGNHVLPGRIGSTDYTKYFAVTADGASGQLAVGSPAAINVTSNYVFGPHYYRIVASEYCTDIDLRDCKQLQSATYKVPSPVRWCSSAANAAAYEPAVGACQAQYNGSLYSHVRYPGRYSSSLAEPNRFPGRFERVEILPGKTFSKASARTDCAADTVCTYAEEMTNFANWWAYYRNRAGLMKTAVSRSFAPVGDNFRVGYMTINAAASGGPDFENVDTFDGTHKSNWFSQLFLSRPSGGTPLRNALSNAGKIFAGQLKTYDQAAVADPIQFSCQQNVVLLSTDGFWNETGTPTGLAGLAIGDQDNSLPAPKRDGTSSANTLADVAAYFRNTDIRTAALNNCTSGSSGNQVCAEVQNLRTYTLGLGASGLMQFRPDYLSADGDFRDIANSLAANPAGGVCAWLPNGTPCTWPVPVSNTLTAVDDLWHAAVNGDGRYFSATDPATLFRGLRSLLDDLTGKTGQAAAATTSSPNVTATENAVFLSNYTTKTWNGELKRVSFDLDAVKVNEKDVKWEASKLLDANKTRKILMASGSSALKEFTWANLDATQKDLFSLATISSGANKLAQFCSFGPNCLSAALQASAAGEPLLNFIRGDRSEEGEPEEVDKAFRKRASVLGAIASSSAVYVAAPRRLYTDPAYAGFKTEQAERKPMVYVGANDGMLHAFDAESGQEVWAFVPSAVLPSLYRLADKEFHLNYQPFVDATPVVSDAVIDGKYATVLIGGLGAGGRSYYALNITDPSNPKLMWEITPKSSGFSNLGLSFGEAIIAKLINGDWVAMFGSGYNNHVSPGNGKGSLFVADLKTGQLKHEIVTSGGSSSKPSGLAHINAWMEDGLFDPTTQRVYGGDNDGNVWRFDVNDTLGPAGLESQRLVVLKNEAGQLQPVTSAPAFSKVDEHVMVYVGTGRYLGGSDLSDTKVQSIYGIRDRLTSQDWGDVRTPVNGFVQQVLKNGTCPAGEAICSAGDTSVRVMDAINPVDLNTAGGCYVDLPVSGERVTVGPEIVLDSLVVASNLIQPTSDCNPGGSGFLNFLDYRTCGRRVASAAVADSPIVGIDVITVKGDAKLPFTCQTNCKKGTTDVSDVPPKTSSGSTRRLSWRDLLRN